MCHGGWGQPSSLKLSPWVLVRGRAAVDMPPQSVSAPCPQPQAQQGTLLHGTSLRDVMAPSYGEGLWSRRELRLLLQGKRDTTGESLCISPSFKHFFSKLKQSTSEAITVSLEASQCKIPQLMALDTPAHCLCLCLKFANKISLLTSTYAVLFSLHPIALPPSSLHTADRHIFTKRLTVSSTVGLAQVPVSSYCLTSVVRISAATFPRRSGRWPLPRDQQSTVLHFTVPICGSEETGKGKKQKRQESNQSN